MEPRRPYVFLWLQVVLMTCIVTSRHGVTCSQCELKTRDSSVGLALCLGELRGIMHDRSLFFFGDTYQLTCPPSSDNINCLNVDPTPASLAERIFGVANATQQTAGISQWIDVTFTSPPGFYHACRNNFTGLQETRFALDPLLNRTTTPWETRMLPNIIWTPSSTLTQYTLIVVDAGFRFLHGLYVNIPGNDLSRGTAIHPYSGPLNMRRVINIYAFLLFEQSVNDISVLRSDLPSVSVTSAAVIAFMTKFGLTRLDAINWMGIDTDAYAGQNVLQPGLFCGISVVEAAVQQHIASSVLPHNPTPSLTVSLDYDREESGSFTDCCEHVNFFSLDHIRVNAIGNQIVPSLYSKLPPTITLIGFTISRDVLKVYLHTLVIADFEVTNSSFGTPARPVIHYMVTNIINGTLSYGNTVISYMPPASKAGESAHAYVVLIYRQNGRVAVTPQDYSTINASEYRYLFNLNQMLSDNSMEFAGMSWFRVAYDAFSPNLSMPESGLCDANCKAVACKDFPGFPSCNITINPLPTTPPSTSTSVAMTLPSKSTLSLTSASTAPSLTQRLTSLRSTLFQMNRFYFGDTYRLSCPIGSDNINCFNMNPTVATLASRMLGNDAFDEVAGVSLWLDVRYNSPAGSYFACGHQFDNQPSTQFTVDPLSGKTSTPWNTRLMPNITWMATSGPVRYTLLVLDPGFQFVHAMIVDIPGNDITLGRAIVPYSGPLNLRFVPNIYAFLLFEQATANIDVAVPRDLPIQGNWPDDLMAFRNKVGLRKLVAVNWMPIIGDAYAQHATRLFGPSCGISVVDAAMKNGIAPSILTNSSVPSVDVVVNFNVPRGAYLDCCGNEVGYNASGDVNIDAIGNQIVPTYFGKSLPNIKLTSFILLRNVLQVYRHTLIVVDFDVIDSFRGTDSKPVIHLLITNIINGSLSTGDTVLSYLPPAPNFNDSAHAYVVLLYRQSSIVSVDPSVYGVKHNRITGHRYLFDLSRMVSVKGMSFAGLSLFRVKHDPSTSYIMRIIQSTCDRHCTDLVCSHDPRYQACASGMIISGKYCIVTIMAAITFAAKWVIF